MVPLPCLRPLQRDKVANRALGRNPAPACAALRWAVRAALLGCACAVLLPACGALAPSPVYTHAPDAAVRRELEQRRRAGDGRLMRVVRGYLGVPYQWGGTTRHGMDCSAFARAIYRETYGVELPRTSRQMYALGSAVEDTARLRRGDLVFFRDARTGSGVSHVGVYVGSGLFAHAAPATGGTLTALDAPYYRARYAGARRITR